MLMQMKSRSKPECEVEHCPCRCHRKRILTPEEQKKETKLVILAISGFLLVVAGLVGLGEWRRSYEPAPNSCRLPEMHEELGP
jgi:hypothetical protein